MFITKWKRSYDIAIKKFKTQTMIFNGTYRDTTQSRRFRRKNKIEAIYRLTQNVIVRRWRKKITKMLFHYLIFDQRECLLFRREKKLNFTKVEIGTTVSILNKIAYRRIATNVNEWMIHLFPNNTSFINTDTMIRLCATTIRSMVSKALISRTWLWHGSIQRSIGVSEWRRFIWSHHIA